MPPDAQKYLQDMLNAANVVVIFADGKSLQDFQSDALLNAAIYWKLVIVGEALSQLKKLDAGTAEKITDWKRIIGFRNQIIHGYSQITDTVTWGIIKRKLPILIEEVKALLDTPDTR